MVKIPDQPSDYTDQQLNNLLTLSDVMATGFHAAKSAEVKKGATTVVIGDGAVGLRGGIASVTTYDKNILLKAVLDGEIDPGKVFTKRFDLDNIQEAYEAIDHREAIKSLVIVADK